VSGVVLRDATPGDAPAIVDFLNEHAREVYGEAEFAVEEIRHWFTMPDLVFAVAESDGRIVGYLDVSHENEMRRWDIDARGLDAAIADLLVAEGEARARAQAAPGAVLRGFASPKDPTAGALARAGLEPIRSSFQMRIELAREIARPEWPEGVVVRAFRPGEDERVYEAHQESFEDHWDYRRTPMDEWRRWLRETPRFDPELWFVAEEGDEIAGVALCAWHWSGDPQFGWVHVLGVRRPWRRRGLGLALLLHAFADFKARGATRVGLGVDAENTTGAVRLYERAGMTVARRNDTYQKKL